MTSRSEGIEMAAPEFKSAAATPTSAAGCSASASASAARGGRYPSLAPALRYEPFRTLLAECETLISEVRVATSAHRRATTLDERERVTALAESLGAHLHDRLRQAREQLRSVQADNIVFAQLHGPSSASSQIRSSLHTQAVRAYASCLRRGEEELTALRSELRSRTERELRFVDPSLDGAQLNALVDSGHAGEFVRARLQAESEAELRAAAEVIQQRHLGIRALERQAQHLAELFRDLATLVDLQQESADVIERRVAATKDAAEEGEEQIAQAHQWQTKANIVGSTRITRLRD